jgi:hypothetical protein
MEETFSVRSVPGPYNEAYSFSRLRLSVVRSEKLVAEAGDSSEIQIKEIVRRWKPLPSNG